VYRPVSVRPAQHEAGVADGRRERAEPRLDSVDGVFLFFFGEQEDLPSRLRADLRKAGVAGGVGGGGGGVESKRVVFSQR
jgi:hypothetical protein